MFSLEKNNALFLDFDGTLVDIASTPDDIKVPNELKKTLSLLRKRLGDAVCIVTGRSEKDLKKWIHPANVHIAAEHGAVLVNTNGIKYYTQLSAPHWEDIKQEIDDFCEEYTDLLCEKKEFGVAIHYRANPSLETKVTKFLKDLHKRHNGYFDLQEGKMVLEIKQKSINKGEAIAILMQTSPFKNRMPVFIGDDKTDEDGFERVNKMEGMTIKVGKGKTKAKHRFNSTDECRQWLKEKI